MKTDAEINALVAEKVAGLKGVEMYARIEGTPLYGVLRKSSHWDGADVYDPIPDYLNDANAVLSLLEVDGGRWSCDRLDDGRHAVMVENRKTLTCYFTATAPTFARAAVFALLKSKGIDVHRED